MSRAAPDRARRYDRCAVPQNPVTGDAYPAARIAAPLMHAYFAKHIEGLEPAPGDVLAPVPDTVVIEEIVNVTFWASLRREEGYFPTISVAYLSPDQAVHAMRFERPLPFTPGGLAKLAPIVERPGIHFGVWHGPDGLQVWGTTLSVPQYCFVLENVEPGLLVVKHHRGEGAGKYVNVAVLAGDQVKLVDESASDLPDCPALLTSLLGLVAPSSWSGSINVLVQLAVSMRAHRRGGSLLIVPAASDGWRESVVTPMAYAVSPAYRSLSTLVEVGGHDEHTPAWQASLRASVDAIAGLTAVDGATVITDSYELLAFGAKIVRRRGSPPIEQVTLTEPIAGRPPQVLTTSQLGGTRHMSAAQFVHDQRSAIALVASQDGRFTVFVWSKTTARLYAYRVEALLL